MNKLLAIPLVTMAWFNFAQAEEPKFAVWSQVTERLDGTPVPQTLVYRIYYRITGSNDDFQDLMGDLVGTQHIVYMPWETCWDVSVTAYIPEEGLESLHSNVLEVCSGEQQDTPMDNLDFVQPLAPKLLSIN